MNLKRTACAVLATFMTTMVWGVFYHLVLMKDADLEIRHLYRPDMSDKMWLSTLGVLGICIFFVLGYVLCARKGTVREGMIYGLCFGVLGILLVDVNQYVLYPIPGLLILKWAFGGLVEFVLNGIWASLICGTVKRVAQKGD